MAKKEINNDLVKTIKGSLSGTNTIESKGSVFEETLPEGLSPEVVKKVNDHVTDFVAAGYVAFAQHSADVMASTRRSTRPRVRSPPVLWVTSPTASIVKRRSTRPRVNLSSRSWPAAPTFASSPANPVPC